MKILVTGAKGFVGRNLCLTLEQMSGMEVLKYDLGDEARLDAYITACDFVMHLAGVNRPKDPAEFRLGNTVFTEDILDRLAARTDPPPVLLSSSIQAALDNDYGKSKAAAEEAVRAYGEKTGAPVYIAWPMCSASGAVRTTTARWRPGATISRAACRSRCAILRRP